MGKSIPSPSRLRYLSRIIISNRLNNNNRPNQIKPESSRARPDSFFEARPTEFSDQQQHRLNNKKMEVGNSNSNSNSSTTTMPLAEVVADCVKRWFRDTLKEARAGDPAMQVLVGQMYCSGYGIPKDAQKTFQAPYISLGPGPLLFFGRAWISRASRIRSSAWKVGDKRPGYNASDSDSDDAT